MSLLDAYDDGTLQAAKAMDAAPLPEPVPEPKHSGWTVVPRFLAGAALEVAGNLVDAGSVIGQEVASHTLPEGVPAIPIDYRPEASRPHYEMAREMRPDPMTAGLAENIIFGVGKGLTKAIASVSALGPMAGAGAFGLSEGMTTSEDLANAGVDADTRVKVGAVTGLTAGVSVLLPVAGETARGTAGLVAASGPAAYVAQEVVVKKILEDANYQAIADQHDPLDPIGLTISTLLPAAFGVMALRGAYKGKATPEELDAAMVHNTTLKADQFEAETPHTVEAMKQAEESVQAAKPMFEQSGEIGKVVTEKLMDIGVPAQEAADKGLLWDSFFKSMEARSGTNASELFNRYFDKVISAKQGPDGGYLDQSDGYRGVPDQDWQPEADFITAAKTHFGVTNNPREAGYVLPDGTMLDFTGRHYSEDHPSLRNQRSVDHRELTGENKNGHTMESFFTQDSGSGSDYMQEFMARSGAMRVDFHSGVTSGMRPPTPEQLRVIGMYTKGQYSAHSYIDPTNGRIVDDVEFDRTKPMDVSKWYSAQKGKTGSGPLFQSAANQTDTPEFRKWFSDSAVVDAEGKPLVVYHSTNADFSEFKKGDGGTFGDGIYLSKTKDEANEYADIGDGSRIMPLYVRITHPADAQVASEVEAKFGGRTSAELERLGYDGIVTDSEIVAFHPEQIKSAIGNRGTFDPNDPNILHQGSRGFLQLGSRMSIGLLSSADKSTFLHESGHFFLEVMNDLSKEVPDLRADMDTVREWMGIKGDTAEARAEAWNAMTLEEKRPFHEQWARGFEQYLMDGKAPNEQLKGAFERFRDWLIEIYKSATALNVKVSNEVRQVMDRMLDSQAKAAQEPSGDVVPPPRAIAGEAPGSDLDKVLADGMPNLENHKPLSDPDIQGMVQDMALNEAGWAEKGGYLIRSGSEVAGEEQISRTKWVPKAEWWPDRPAQGKRRLNEAQIQEAVRKAIAGEPLKPLEQSTVDYMTAIANDRIQGVDQIGWEEFGRAMDDVIAHGEGPTTENVFDYEAMVRAIELNPEAAKSAQEAYDIHNDDAVFMAEIRSIIDEKVQQATQSVPGSDGEGGAEPAKPAEQPDPITAEAARIAQSSPDVRIEVGTDESGQPITKSIQEYLDDAKAGADQARKDVSLIQAAAECLLGSL